jgi:hypothetical protein
MQFSQCLLTLFFYWWHSTGRQQVAHQPKGYTAGSRTLRKPPITTHMFEVCFVIPFLTWDEDDVTGVSAWDLCHRPPAGRVPDVRASILLT